MKAKFDKDALIKHRFWILLGVTIPLVLAAVLILITSVGAEIESYRKKAEEKYTAASKASPGAGPLYVDELGKIAGKWKEQETSVHKVAFMAQKDLFVWPKAVEDKFDFQNGMFVTEVKILPNPGDNWPNDDGALFHGIVQTPHEDYLIVRRKDGSESKFYPTFKTKISRQQPKPGEREPLWGNLATDEFVAITYYTSKYFYDQLTVSEQREYVNSYRTQIHPILQIVDPVDVKGNGTVQFNGWLYKPNDYPLAKSKFFTYVAEPWQADSFIYQEAWLAQEDLWIQRELFRIIRAANDDVAVCQGTPVKGKATPAVFKNPNFELKFEWEESDRLMVTVKNMLPRRQKLDVQFRVKFNESPNRDLSSEIILLDGEPLDPIGTPKDSLKKEIPIEKGRIQRNGIYAVEQVLTWETAPVKRIDHVAIGSASAVIAHSHKTYPKGSQPYRKDPKKEEVAAQGDANPMGMALGPMGLGGPKLGGGGGGEGEQAQANFGINGVLLDRYLEVSEQSRRLPVGLSLIVDQDHIGRVLTAFNNSKLRFLTTQVLLNRYSQSLRPRLVGSVTDPEGGGMDDEAAPPPPMPMGGGFPMDGGFMPPKGGSSLGMPKGFGSSGGPPQGIGKGFSPPPMGGVGGGGPNMGIGAGAMAHLAGAEELENNVEVVIYGIVTLYERYPKRTLQVGDAK